MFRNLTIARKGLLVLLLPLLYQAVLLGVLVRRQREQVEAQEWVVHTKDILGTIDRVQLTMQRLQGALRGYLITGLEDFERESQAALREVPVEMAALRNLTASFFAGPAPARGANREAGGRSRGVASLDSRDGEKWRSEWGAGTDAPTGREAVDGRLARAGGGLSHQDGAARPGAAEGFAQIDRFSKTTC